MEFLKRKPQRLKDYDYSQNNAYFITICAQNMLPLFGRIINGSVVLSDAGKMVDNKLKELTIYNITVDKHIVTPKPYPCNSTD